jgi:hypothetical protein
MKAIRWSVLIGLLSLIGCDAGTAAVLLLQSRDKKSDSGPPPPPGFLTPVFKAWIANLPDTAAADAEQAALVAADGNPSTSVWTELGVFTVTEIFDPDDALPPWNTILIQVSSTQNYDLDCVEILDDQNRVLGYASGPTWSDLVDFPDEILGPPDGKSATTTAAGTTRAFIFTRYTAAIDRFRINGHPPAAPAPGDVEAVGGFTSASDEKPGGLAIDANGLIHLTLSVGDTGRLVRYDLNGVYQDGIEITNDLATAGSPSVALNSTGIIFTSCSVGSGIIQVRRFESNLSPGAIAGFTSTLGGDRVEHNSIAVDGSGFIVVVGGMSSLTSGRNHWRIKLPDTVSGTPVWQDSTSLDLSNTTYWHAVTTGANDNIFTAGDLSSGLLGTDQVYAAQFNSAGAGQWADEWDDGQAPADLGQAIALDGSGNIYVGGFAGTDTNGRDGLLLRYTDTGAFSNAALFTGPAGGDDEILDIAVDSDGFIYAVGYETVTSQGENMWIRKYEYDTNNNEFNTIWTRTHDGGFGNDRAISVAISGSNLVVAGYETNSGGQTKLVLRVYAK